MLWILSIILAQHELNKIFLYQNSIKENYFKHKVRFKFTNFHFDFYSLT